MRSDVGSGAKKTGLAEKKRRRFIANLGWVIVEKLVIGKFEKGVKYPVKQNAVLP